MTEFEITSRGIDDYRLVTPIAQLRSALFRSAILFGVAVAGIGMIAVPHGMGSGDEETVMYGQSLDMMTTGSIGSSDLSGTYRIQRSILQQDNAPCVMWPDGRQQGAC